MSSWVMVTPTVTCRSKYIVQPAAPPLFWENRVVRGDWAVAAAQMASAAASEIGMRMSFVSWDRESSWRRSLRQGQRERTEGCSSHAALEKAHRAGAQ